jgi:hypothetical protein
MTADSVFEPESLRKGGLADASPTYLTKLTVQQGSHDCRLGKPPPVRMSRGIRPWRRATDLPL